MQVVEVMRSLKEMGTAQNVKIYKRHGAQEPLFGVSFANLNQLKRKIKVDHGLAEQLWESGNSDARTLALMVADPSQVTSKQADAWLKGVDYYLIGDMLGSLVAKSKHAGSKIKAWCKRKAEYPKQVGYSIVANLLTDDPQRLSVEECQALVERIESEIHDSPNRAKQTMNQALIAIGVAKPAVRKEVIAAAKRIGVVEVDHGETSCKTPDAVAYIQKTVKHQAEKKKQKDQAQARVRKKKAAKRKTAKRKTATKRS